ncbi:MAG: NAD(P)-binding domain-containing protein, partial [Maritimibacter sp.]|nr:NAD(P)-binding domain-containing protein [Maritimibacter sp.]
MEKTEVLVVGGGQAGIAMSEHLGAQGIDHLVLERGRTAERWRSERWDSLVANGPAWHDRFPNRLFEGHDPDAFVPKEGIADYLVAYAAQVNAPLREGVEVTRVTRKPEGAGFLAETSAGPVEAQYVVAATGPFQRPVIPPIVPETPAVTQIHSTGYKNPEALPEGGVLVVGAGSSGVQIAAELAAAGRKTWLSVGPHDRPPRRYRGRDFVW